MPPKHPISPPESSNPPSPASPNSHLAQAPGFLTASPSTINQNFIHLEEHSATLIGKPDSTLTHPVVHLRDRYPSIKTFAHNRIKLSCLDFSYINASPIDLGRSNETFIATQGPESSVHGAGLFWRLAWQEKCKIVIMLTPVFERGQERCGLYYPELVGAVKDLGEWGSVECVRQITECKTEIRELKVVKTEEDGSTEERVVFHFHFLAWPDHDVPKTDEDRLALLCLIKMSRFLIDNINKTPTPDTVSPLPPRIVHCSAGVGRTGTFIALDYLLQDFEEEKWDVLREEEDPIFETVKSLREQRMGLVYKQGQYAFLYETLAEKWAKKEGLRIAATRSAVLKRVGDEVEREGKKPRNS